MELSSKETQEVFACNMGVIIGGEEFNERALDQAMLPEIEHFEIEELSKMEDEDGIREDDVVA